MELIENDGDVTLLVKVVPRASRSEIVGFIDDALKVRLTSPPVDGAANAELIKLLAKSFGLSRSHVEIIAGETSKNKRVRLNGISGAAVKVVLEKHFTA